MPDVPGFLSGYEALYAEDPRDAARAWFNEQRLGLLVHYGLYSLEGRGEWLMYADRIRPDDYAMLLERFTAERFDADVITDLAVAAEMSYVNFVTKHCDSFCLWDTAYTDFNSVNAPAGRDLVAEMADSCARKGLGLFVFYEHGFDWRHPHGPAPWEWTLSTVRPPYDPAEPWYASRADYDLQNYVDYAGGQIEELLTKYGPVAGVWLDGAAVPLSGETERFKLDELYGMIRRLQPHALISYKWGVTGDEDNFAPEWYQIDLIKEPHTRRIEINRPLQKQSVAVGRDDGPEWGGAWGYESDDRCAHCTPDDVWRMVEHAAGLNATLSLNIGPLPDGSIHPDDVATLSSLGERIRAEGHPTAVR